MADYQSGAVTKRSRPSVGQVVYKRSEWYTKAVHTFDVLAREKSNTNKNNMLNGSSFDKDRILSGAPVHL